MFKSRSPFLIPSVPGTASNTRKTSMEDERKREMSIETPNKQVTMQQSPKVSLPSVCDEKFCFELSQPDQNDQTLFWSYDLTNQVINESRRTLIFREQQYYLKGRRETEVYQTIYITADSIPGYKNEVGVATNRICALHLVDIDATVDSADQKTYDLLYKQIQDVAWEIPMDLTQVSFRIQRDNEVLSGPLSIPLVCQFDIRHSGN